MIMVLPFVTALVAGLLAFRGHSRAAFGIGLVTVAIQVWWLVYHATDKLAIGL